MRNSFTKNGNWLFRHIVRNFCSLVANEKEEQEGNLLAQVTFCNQLIVMRI